MCEAVCGNGHAYRDVDYTRSQGGPARGPAPRGVRHAPPPMDGRMDRQQ